MKLRDSVLKCESRESHVLVVGVVMTAFRLQARAQHAPDGHVSRNFLTLRTRACISPPVGASATSDETVHDTEDYNDMGIGFGLRIQSNPLHVIAIDLTGSDSSSPPVALSVLIYRLRAHLVSPIFRAL